jgi:sugar/nucleoside kinase (ribokinase family)
VAQELETTLANQFQDSLVVATLQGWMRRWNDEGVISLGDWRRAEEVLSRLDAAVVSVEDIDGDWTLAEQWAEQIPILVVTQDKDGCTLFHHGEQQSFPARPTRVIDPTGAGDVFAAAFFIRLYETRDPCQSARFANVTASMALELPGTSGIPRRTEVEAYLVRGRELGRYLSAKPGRGVSQTN